MKNILTLIMTALVVFTSCVKDDTSNCNGNLVMMFTHLGTTRGYDEIINNDIHLRIYRDNILVSAMIVPYEQIAGGKEVKIKKEATGHFDIIAWAVPSNGGFVSDIPEPVEDRGQARAFISMKKQKEYDTYEPVGEIFLGTFAREVVSGNGDTYFPVAMRSCVAKFTSTIHDVPELYTPGQDDRVWLVAGGIKSQLDTDFNAHGEDAAVFAEFTEKESDEVVKTGVYGLLPSGVGQTLNVEFYKEGKYRGSVSTDKHVNPGDEIHLDVHRNFVVIYVNGWQTVNESVDWI